MANNPIKRACTDAVPRSEEVKTIYRLFMERLGMNVKKKDLDTLRMPDAIDKDEIELCATVLLNVLREKHGDDWCTDSRCYKGEVNLLASIIGYTNEWSVRDGCTLAGVASALARMHQGNPKELSWYHIQMLEIKSGFKLANPFNQSFDEEGLTKPNRTYLGRYSHDMQNKVLSELHRRSDGESPADVRCGCHGMWTTGDPTISLFSSYEKEARLSKINIATALKAVAEPLSTINHWDVCGYWSHDELASVDLYRRARSTEKKDVAAGHVPNVLEILLREAIMESIGEAAGDMALLDQYSALIDAQNKRLEEVSDELD